MSATIQTPLYGTFARRVRALVLDGIVLTMLMLVIVFLVSVVQFDRPVRLAFFVAVLCLIVLYEPVLVSFHGSTIGQRLSNLRVVAPTANGRLPLWKAFVRWLLKVVTGFASFATMGATRRNQALHDIPFGTTVEIADPSLAREWDYVLERNEATSGRLPPRWRRVVVIASYLIALLSLLNPAVSIGASFVCINKNRCGSGERVWVQVVSTAWLAASVAACIFGWKGRLLGARRCQIRETSSPQDSGAAT